MTSSSQSIIDSGREFVRAKFTSRVPKDQAQKLLDTYLGRCAEVNTRTGELPFVITEVWLYGSMIDTTKIEVADIDLLEMTGQPECSQEEINQRYDELFEKLGISVRDRGIFWVFEREERLRQHFLQWGEKTSASKLQRDLIGVAARFALPAYFFEEVGRPAL